MSDHQPADQTPQITWQLKAPLMLIGPVVPADLQLTDRMDQPPPSSNTTSHVQNTDETGDSPALSLMSSWSESVMSEVSICALRCSGFSLFPPELRSSFCWLSEPLPVVWLVWRGPSFPLSEPSHSPQPDFCSAHFLFLFLVLFFFLFLLFFTFYFMLLPSAGWKMNYLHHTLIESVAFRFLH